MLLQKTNKVRENKVLSMLLLLLGESFLRKSKDNPTRVGQSLWLASYHLTVATQPNFQYKPLPNSSWIYAYARARVQSFYVFAFTSSPFGGKVLSKCELRVKVSPFCLHLFFAIGVVQDVEIQLVVVKVKVNAGFAFTLNRLIYSLLWGEVKGEGKKGKFAESAGAYIRVGACPARRMKGILCGVGRFWEKGGLYFSSGVGEGEKNNFSCLLVLDLFCDVLCALSFSFCFSMMSFYFSFLCLSFGRTFFVLILFRLR